MIKNQVQLITYVDRLGGNSLSSLTRLLTGPLQGVFGGIHLLPFFYPVDGEDAGFDPIDHSQVDPDLGTWSDIQELSLQIDLMADLIVNHISADSPQFQDVLRKGTKSPYFGLFLTLDRVFSDGAKESDLTQVYRPRPGLPFTSVSLEDGNKRLFWTTFTSNQIDIDVRHPAGEAYLEQILRTFQQHGIRMIRLDAVGYAIKTKGTSCFMTPHTFAFIDDLKTKASEMGMEVLVEIHSYFRQQIAISKQVDRVYDFALPPLVLHTLFSQSSLNLRKWLEISPRNAITVLDTHDGIGIVDIGPGSQPGEEEGLVSPAELDTLVETIHERSKGQSRLATGAAASNLDLYQVNCTFYDALGRDDQQYLLARMIQFFVPGIPQVYYVGLLAGENDMELLLKTGVGRDINRHYYSAEEVERQLKKAVVQDLISLIRFRNTHPAFNGRFSIQEGSHTELSLRWETEEDWTQLWVDLSVYTYELSFSDGKGKQLFHTLTEFPKASLQQ